MATVKAAPFSREEFEKFGGLIHHACHTDKTSVGNFGTSTRTTDIIKTENLYANAPSKVAAWPSTSVCRSVPRTSADDPGRTDLDNRVAIITHLERHPYTSQSFIPTGTPEDQECYLVTVCEKLASSNDPENARPDLSTLKVFVAKGDQGVNYGANVWHSPMTVIRPTNFTIFQHMNGVPEDDLDLIELDEPIKVFY